MTREEQIKGYIGAYIEQYAEIVDCCPKEVEHIGNFIRTGINWAESHPKDEVNWQQARIQAAIASMQGLLACSETRGTYESFARDSVGYADALVKELKGE